MSKVAEPDRIVLDDLDDLDPEAAAWEEAKGVLDSLDSIPGTLDKDAQKIAAKLASLLPLIRETGYYHLFELAQSAARALNQTPPRTEFAKELTVLVERQIRLSNKVVALVSGLFAGTYGLLLIVVLLVWAFTFSSNGFGFSPDSLAEMRLVAIAGGLGASVSVAWRIREPGTLRKIDRNLLFWTGAFKPLVGIAFALFVYMALKAGIVNIAVAEPNRLFLFLFAAVGFAAGFSERLATDVIKRAESTVSTSETKVDASVREERGGDRQRPGSKRQHLREERQEMNANVEGVKEDRSPPNRPMNRHSVDVTAESSGRDEPVAERRWSRVKRLVLRRRSSAH